MGFVDPEAASNYIDAAVVIVLFKEKENCVAVHTDHVFLKFCKKF
jgi:hypothetical protein